MFLRYPSLNYPSRRTLSVIYIVIVGFAQLNGFPMSRASHFPGERVSQVHFTWGDFTLGDFTCRDFTSRRTLITHSLFLPVTLSFAHHHQNAMANQPLMAVPRFRTQAPWARRTPDLRPQTVLFFALARELRDKIYGFSLEGPTTRMINFIKDTTPIGLLKMNVDNAFSPVLAGVSKQFSVEYLEKAAERMHVELLISRNAPEVKFRDLHSYVDLFRQVLSKIQRCTIVARYDPRRRLFKDLDAFKTCRK